MGELWNLVFLEPTLNGLVVLYSYLWRNFGITIIIFTIIIRLLILPLTLRQLKATKAMTSLQPKLLELQRKYAKNKQKLAQEQMKLYKESGMNPMGCLWPMVVQFPVWIALYQAILQALASTPEDLLSLSGHLYSWPVVSQMVPLQENFLWLNLDQPDRIMLLPILTAASMWAQQKMITTPSADPRQASMNRMMLWMMPLMFGLFSLSFPSGLALYWVVSNVVGIIIQYFISGWGGLLPSPPPEKRTEYARPGVPRQERGRSHSTSPKGIKGEPGSGGDNGDKEGPSRAPRAGR